jgi:SAM-dependent methyltransferase
MRGIYREDLAYVQAAGFSDFARGVAPDIVRRLRGSEIPVRTVVEVGCGAGPLSAELARSGFEVTGIDISRELLEIARTGAPGAQFVHGSIYDKEIPPCEAILAVGEPLTYHADSDADAHVREFFRRASRHLPAGGLLIFDLIELGEPALAGRFWKSGEDWAVMVETTEDQRARKLVREIEVFRKVGEYYRRSHETHRVHLFETTEVCEWLDGIGFSVQTAVGYGDYKLAPRRRAYFCSKVRKN